MQLSATTWLDCSNREIFDISFNLVHGFKEVFAF